MRQRLILIILLTGSMTVASHGRADTYIGRGSSNVTAPGDARKTALSEAVRDAVRRAVE